MLTLCVVSAVLVESPSNSVAYSFHTSAFVVTCRHTLPNAIKPRNTHNYVRNHRLKGMHSAACAGANDRAHEKTELGDELTDLGGEWIDLVSKWTDLGGESAEQLLQLVAVTAARTLLAVSNVLVHGSH